MKLIQKIIAVLVFFCFNAAANAATPAWQIVPEQSKIEFTATQNNAPVSGSFKTFAGDINFDPAQLSSSHVHLTVDLNSISSDSQEVGDTLKTADWFNLQQFPQAIFTATNFIKTGEKTYRAAGNLTIRDKTVPSVLDFTLEKYTKDEAKVTGTTILKRLQFGVGQGEFANTDTVKDEVKVSFVLVAKNK